MHGMPPEHAVGSRRFQHNRAVHKTPIGSPAWRHALYVYGEV
jgi:hypothetical protein